MTLITRFAPSPTGYLHLGHALSALTCQQVARENKGRLLLRIEDVDFGRCRPEYETAIYEDLAWLGIEWEEPVRRQSDHMDDYDAALARLKDMHVVYPCFCSRKDIADAVRAAGGEKLGPDGPEYPGTCRHLTHEQIEERLAKGEKPGWRLNLEMALTLTGPLAWHDQVAGIVPVKPEGIGDVLIVRRDVATSYHLSVTVDDHLQKITTVVRGMDLFETTDVHRILQALLGYHVPEYFHHRLLIDDDTGVKLSKRDHSTSLRSLREAGVTVEEIRKRVGF